MTLHELSPYAAAAPAVLAAAAAQDAFRGGPEGDDPVMAALYHEARQFMHGACSLLASHLNESRGLPVLLVQGRQPGQGWMTRHAMACPCGEAEAAAMLDAGRGYEVPVLDAAGGGTVGQRLPLYAKPGWEYQAILAADPGCNVRWMWEPRPGRPLSRQEGVIPRLPALAHALGVPFDLREALAAIIGDMDDVPDLVLESGLLDALGLGRGPSPGA